jgi:hypothetical protein
MSWNFFASEPVTARFSAPFFPSAEPVKNSYLSIGEFDIGKWYRTFMLEYHVPITSTYFSIKQDQPLFFIEFFTNKKIKFKRYTMSSELANLALEAGQSPTRYGQRKSLFERYKMAHGAGVPKMVLREIQKNLVD